MIERTAASSLIPQLISLLKGNDLKEVKTELPVIYMEYDEDNYQDVPELSSNSQYICVLSLKTPVYKYDQFCGPMGTRSMTRILKEWESSESVLGVVIDIDSPGGQVTGLAEFAKFIHGYSKPIVAYTDGSICSAAFYIAAACNGGIISNEHADFIGSIGTMLSYVNLDGILKDQGATIRDIYATGSPRKSEEHREMEKGNDSLIIKQVLDPYRNLFVKDMNAYRPGMVEEVFEGAVYFPSQALENKLIDSIGTIQDAFDKVVSLAKPKKNSNQNSNTNMSKQRAKLQAVLGLSAPLASTEENGSYLNMEQLDQVESRLDALETENSTLQTQLTEAQANPELQTKLTTAETTITGVETTVETMLTEAGLTATGTLTEKLTSLSAHVVELGKKDGASHTTVRTEANADTKKLDYVDASAGHNQLANEIFK